MRSAELTPELGQRSHRLLLAAYAAYRASSTSLAETLLTEARRGQLDRVDLAHAQLLEGMVSLHIGTPWKSPAFLLEAARAFAPFDTGLSHRAFLSALLAFRHAVILAEGTTGRELGEAALSALGEAESDSTVDILLAGIASAYAQDFAEAVPMLRRALDHFEQMSDEDLIEWGYIATFLATELWDAGAFHLITERMEEVARRRGALLPPPCAPDVRDEENMGRSIL